MAYQSFPWEQGDSLSANKLVALDLPRLEGKSVLDVGCNAGFFCGFAAWQGAAKVTGVDQGRNFIETAKSLFPQCRFLCQDWMSLDDEKYDVILFLSAIHYAPDQEAAIDFFMRRLKPGGVLVLEIGIAPGTGDKFVEVARSPDKRFFPTSVKLGKMLGKYAPKHIGKSVSQAGDPVPRAVYHVRHKLPVAILLMDDPHSGKTTTSNAIFRDDIPRFSGDMLYYEIMHGKTEAPEGLKALIDEWREGDILNCAAITYKICRNDMLGDLCGIFSQKSAGGSFLLDMYVSPPCREKMRAWWSANGYFVVDVSLRQSGGERHARETGANKADCDAYMQYLQTDFLVNEKEYLAANPDVARAVASGHFPNGQFHYWHFGRKEGRKTRPDE